MNPHIKNFVASGAVGHQVQVKFTANDGEVAVATAPTDKIAGVTDCPGGVANGGRVDVILFGPAKVKCGGTITPGAAITAGAAGVAVAAAPAAGVNANIAGRLLVNAVNGDIAEAFVNPGTIQGA